MVIINYIKAVFKDSKLRIKYTSNLKGEKRKMCDGLKSEKWYRPREAPCNLHKYSLTH